MFLWNLLAAAAVLAGAVGPACPAGRGVSLLQRRTLFGQTEGSADEQLSAQNPAGVGAGDEFLQVGSDDAAAGAAARARWVASGQRQKASAVPPLKEWPFQCQAARKVCFIENEMVALDPAERGGDGPPVLRQTTDEVGASYWHVPDASPLDWFSQQSVTYNLPGYFDGLNGVQSSASPISVRAASRSMETAPLWKAPLLNVTPIVVFPQWPFNFGDSMGPVFFHSWVNWAAKFPGMWSHPLAIAIPHSLRLPSFWKLLESSGPGVESFSSLSQASTTESPLCFEKVIGCTAFDGRGSWRSSVVSDGGAAWESFRQTLVADRCPGKASAEAAPSGRMVVGLVQRSRGRQLVNIDDLLQQCRLMAPTLGREVVCKKVSFSDILEDICALQDLDVIIGTHGAQLMNSLFMRPGSALVEVRPNEWYGVDSEGRLDNPDSWPNTIAQKLWLTNNTQYWWYGVEAKDSFPDTRSKVPGRDSNVSLSWPILACMLEQIAPVRRREDYIASSLPIMKNAGCKDPLAQR